MSPAEGTNYAARVYSHACLVDGTSPGLGLCFLVDVCAVCFISWHSEWIWTPAAHRSVTSRPVSDMCRFVIISISDLFTLWSQNRKKSQRIFVCFLLERKKQQLYRHHVWKQKNSASSKSLTKKARTDSETCPIMLQQKIGRETASLDGFTGLVLSPMFGHECEFIL